MASDMIPLPHAKQEFRCRNKDNQGRQCDQRIYQSDIKKFRSGKGMVLNAENGRGGFRNDPHVCPDRVGSNYHKGDHFFNKFEYKLKQQYKTCPECATSFNSEVMVLCPNCFKLECRKCENLQSWIIGGGRECFNCGGLCDVRQVFTAYQRLYGKYA
jgi:hypothetical protein